MPMPPLPPAALAAQLAAFERDGAIVLPGALSAAEVEQLRGAIASNRARQPRNWTLRGAEAHGAGGGPVGESGRWQTDELLRTETDAVALVARHPLLMQLASALIGPTCRFSNVGCMHREPVPEPPSNVPDAFATQGIHWQMWHREAGGSAAPDHALCIPSLQCLFYLDDCTEDSHCFSFVPESVAQKRALPHETADNGGGPTADGPDRMRVRRDSVTGSDDMWRNVPLEGRPGWPPELKGRDALAPAGALVVQNNHNLHAGTVRGPTNRPRRTLHVGYRNMGSSHVKERLSPAALPDAAGLSARLRGARARAQAFVAGVPAENRWMYDAAELYHGMFAKHDSGYPPPPEHEQEEQAAAGTAGSARL
jgi:hypothetical protein